MATHSLRSGLAQSSLAAPTRDAVSSAPTAISDRETISGPPGIRMPAVLARDLSSLNLNADQQQAIETLADEFVDKVGEAHPDLSELYRRRVWAAISESDARYRLLYGDRAYVQLQLLASRQLAQ